MVRPGMLRAFDFDGTLAPTVHKPGQFSVPATTRNFSCSIGAAWRGSSPKCLRGGASDRSGS